MGVNATTRVAVLGAGPAGLTAAHALARRGIPVRVFEADDVVGGIARTVEHDGFRFDLGGHRFFTKIGAVQTLWVETLGVDFLVRPRLSRIYYRGRYFSYPLRAEDVVRRLGLLETLRCAGSYAWSRTRRGEPPATFEGWVTARFGRRLYDAFFRSYTEKVWGIPGNQIQSEWASQRIRNLSFWTALASAMRLRRRHVTSLIEQFHYPRLGPGQMWETLRTQIEDAGVPVDLNHRCVSIRHDDGVVTDVVVQTKEGDIVVPVSAVLSSMPLSELVLALDPAPPGAVVDAARRLRYRDLIVVGLMTHDPEPFPDNWIYLHDPGIRAGRLQNFGRWSPDMARPGHTCLGVEYFCFAGDELWSSTDDELVALATRELAAIELIDTAHVTDGIVIRVPRAYPMYDLGYADAVTAIRDHLAGFENLLTFGRNGLHRYNNQDHSMLTAMLAVQNLVDGTAHDLWSVNTDAEFHEEGTVSSGLPVRELASAVT